MAESINFASPRWVEYGKLAILCSCFKYGIKFCMDTFVKRFQLSKYDLWCQGKDVGCHPEDPSRSYPTIDHSKQDMLCCKK